MIFNSGNAGSNSVSRGSASSTNNIEDSIFVDLQRLQLQLRQFQSLSEGHQKEMNDFQRVAKDDFQRLWDNVNELQEIANVTTKNMEDIYDKDILPLQNFKTATENDMNKLREEMDDFLSLKESSSSTGGGNAAASEEAIRILNKSNRKMEMLEDEQQRQKVQLEKLQESQTLTRTEIQRIFEDIDGFKKKSQVTFAIRFSVVQYYSNSVIFIQSRFYENQGIFIRFFLSRQCSIFDKNYY